LHIRIKFFQGSIDSIEKSFNTWSKNKYVSETTLHLKRNAGQEHAILKVLYGDK
jgi:hypothetical protein